MQAGGDGFGWRVTAEHMTFQDPGVFIPRHICKVPGREENTRSMKTLKKEENAKGMKMMRRGIVGLVTDK